MVLDGEKVAFSETDLRVLGCGEDPGVVARHTAEFMIDRAYSAAGTAKEEADSDAMVFHKDVETLASRDGVNVMAVPGLRTGYQILGGRQLRFAQQIQAVRAMSDNLGERLN